MIKNLWNFIKTTLIGGIVVLLPIFVLIIGFTFLFNFITNIIRPISKIIFLGNQLNNIIGDIIAIIIIVLFCFMTGLLISTRIGYFFLNIIEKRVLKKIPGYNLIRETVKQLTSNQETPFSSVALVKLYQSDTLSTAFITDHHNDGSYTVFVPTGPNPTSGNIFHLSKDKVYKLDIPVETAMKSIIGCGSGSKKLLESFQKKFLRVKK